MGKWSLGWWVSESGWWVGGSVVGGSVVGGFNKTLSRETFEYVLKIRTA